MKTLMSRLCGVSTNANDFLFLFDSKETALQVGGAFPNKGYSVRLLVR